MAKHKHRQKTFWIINQTAGSAHHGMVYRNYYIAREWVKQGHRAIIISSSFFHNFTKLPTTKGLFTREIIDGIEYWWVKMPRYTQSQSLGRLFSIFLFPLKLFLFPFWRLPRPDTIIVSGPPHVPIINGWLWSRWLRATLVYEVRDIWPMTIEKLGGVSSWHPVIFILSIIERLAYMASDRVVSVLALAWRHFESRGMLKAKFAYLPNGVDIADTQVDESETSRKVAEIARTKFTILYTGSLGIANNLDQLLEAAEILKGDKDIHFVLVGEGPHRSKLEEKAKKIGNVSVFPPVPKKDIAGILSHGHICYVGLQKSPIFKHGVSPNKLFDYMASSKPIVMAIDTEDDIVGRAQCGISVPSCLPVDIAKAIKELRSASAQKLAEMGRAARVYLENHHTYSALAEDYVQIAEEGRRPLEESARWALSPFWFGFWFVMTFGAFAHFVFPMLAPKLFQDGITLFLDDPHFYHGLAQKVAQMPWSEFTFKPQGQFPAGLLAFVYKVTGVSLPFMFLPVLAALAGLTIRGISSCLDILGVRGRWWPLLIGFIFTVGPTSVSWMVYPMKDAFIVPGIVLITWTLMAVTLRRIRIRHFIAFSFGCLLVLTSKTYFAELLLAGTILALPFAWRYPASVLGRYGRIAFFMFVLSVFYLMTTIKGGYSSAGVAKSTKSTPVDVISTGGEIPRHLQVRENWEEIDGFDFLNKPLSALAYTRERFLFERPHGGTNFMPDLHLHGAKDTLLYTPRALQLALLEPMPWREMPGGGAKNLLEVSLKFEMLLVYLSLIFLFTSGRKAWSTPTLICLALAIPFLLAFGFAVPNIGAINRYRFPFLILVKLAGFAALWNASRSRWPGRLLAWVDPVETHRKKKKLLFLVPDDATFIIQRLVMARGALEAGYEVHVACPDLGHAQKIRELGFIFHNIDLNRGGLNPLKDFTAFVHLVFFLAKERPDILNNVSIKPVIYGSTSGTIVGLKRIVNLVNGLGYAFERQGIRGELVHTIAVVLYRNALALPGVRVIFQNPDDRAYFIGHKMVDADKTIIIRGSGVDMKKFAPTPLPNGPIPVVLFVGRLLWSKGIQELVDAVTQLRSQGLKFRLVIVGEPDDRNPETVPREVIQKWHEQGHIEYMGRQSDMPKFYREADIVCLPTSYREGLPLTLLEAASVGRPLVATDIPGCKEVVRPGENGFLVSPKNSNALAEALRALLEDQDLRNQMGRASTELVKREFASSIVQGKLLNVYSSLYEIRPPAGGLSPV